MPSDPSVWFTFLKCIHLKPFKMIFKSSWMVLFSFTISAIIKKKIHFIFFPKCQLEKSFQESQTRQMHQEFPSVPLCYCRIYPQKEGPTNLGWGCGRRGFVASGAFSTFLRQKGSSSSHTSRTCWWWTFPTFILPPNSLTRFYLNSTPTLHWILDHIIIHKRKKCRQGQRFGEYSLGEDWKTTSSATNLRKPWSGAGHLGFCC